ncbi:hypothetical protein EDD18DRAFT_1105077 [Armillaria luteobubalina]|uniref:Uncharacterized protein n=1 Tax=Armillaria luteobubalina TaxID=153913 RepID=A0AA39Q5P2_9AGAR|nr:hypothetical protein EDD18DRAFT_1105077 [Armillaria luteobubalina]
MKKKKTEREREMKGKEREVEGSWDARCVLAAHFETSSGGGFLLANKTARDVGIRVPHENTVSKGSCECGALTPPSKGPNDARDIRTLIRGAVMAIRDRTKTGPPQINGERPSISRADAPLTCHNLVQTREWVAVLDGEVAAVKKRTSSILFSAVNAPLNMDSNSRDCEYGMSPSPKGAWDPEWLSEYCRIRDRLPKIEDSDGHIRNKL